MTIHIQNVVWKLQLPSELARLILSSCADGTTAKPPTGWMTSPRVNRQAIVTNAVHVIRTGRPELPLIPLPCPSMPADRCPWLSPWVVSWRTEACDLRLEEQRLGRWITATDGDMRIRIIDDGLKLMITRRANLQRLTQSSWRINSNLAACSTSLDAVCWYWKKLHDQICQPLSLQLSTSFAVLVSCEQWRPVQICTASRSADELAADSARNPRRSTPLPPEEIRRKMLCESRALPAIEHEYVADAMK